MSLSRPAVAALLLSAVAGCGDGVVRREVSGTVTFDGGPLPSGLIEFDPLDGQPTRTDAKVADGKFRLARSEGLADGRYRVRIISTGKTDPIPVPDGHKGPPPIPKEWIPKKIPDRYNRASELTADVGDRANEFAFDLKGDGKAEAKHDFRKDGKFTPGVDAPPGGKR